MSTIIAAIVAAINTAIIPTIQLSNDAADKSAKFTTNDAAIEPTQLSTIDATECVSIATAF